MQSRYTLISLLTLLIAFPTTILINPLSDDSKSDRLQLTSPNDLSENTDAVASHQVQAIIPTSEQLVDGAISVLSKGWKGMDHNEREAFLALFDPAGTGDIDGQFVEIVLNNYQLIREELGREIAVLYESDSNKCQDMRLYYTDLFTLHVCPYFLVETNEVRKARTLVHEMAHTALLVTDRPYYRPTSEAYTQLTPNGSWMAQLPIVGPVLREFQGRDTLYHPDAYAHFTVAVSGQPVAMGMYVNHHQVPESAGETEIDSQPLASDSLVVDSWILGS